MGSAAVSVALVLSACSASTPATPATEEWIATTPEAVGAVDSVTWNLLLEPASLDPANSNNYGENTVLSNLCDNLLRLNPDFTIESGLATLTPNEDHTVLTLDIDPAATFWDGTPVTGEDAAYSLTRNWQPPISSNWVGYFDSVSGIEATGERQVTVTLTTADVLFEQILATTAGAVYQKAQAEAAGDLFGTANAAPVCSGPYRFVDWKQGSELNIEKNPDYWGGDTALVEAATFTFLQGDATQTTALTGDAAQGMYNPPYTGLRQLSSHGQVFYGESLLTFFMSPTRKPGPLQDPRIRQALYMALDRSAVAEKAFGGAAVATQSLLPKAAYTGGVEPTLTAGTGGSADEIAQAKKLVEEAGSPTEPIVIAAFTGITESMNQSLEALVEAGKSIGLNIEFASITLGEYYGLFGGPTGWEAVNADGFGFQDYVPVADPLAQYSKWISPDGSENYGGFTDAALSAKIVAAKSEIDDAARATLETELDKELFAKLPALPIVNVANVLYLQKGLTGAPASFVNLYSPWLATLGASD